MLKVSVPSRPNNVVPFRRKDSANKENTSPAETFPDKVFTAVCSHSNCGWSHQVRIPASDNTPTVKEGERQTMIARHKQEVRGCPGEIILIQDTGIRRGGTT